MEEYQSDTDKVITGCTLWLKSLTYLRVMAKIWSIWESWIFKVFDVVNTSTKNGHIFTLRLQTFKKRFSQNSVFNILLFFSNVHYTYATTTTDCFCIPLKWHVSTFQDQPLVRPARLPPHLQSLTTCAFPVLMPVTCKSHTSTDYCYLAWVVKIFRSLSLVLPISKPNSMLKLLIVPYIIQHNCPRVTALHVYRRTSDHCTAGLCLRHTAPIHSLPTSTDVKKRLEQNKKRIKNLEHLSICHNLCVHTGHWKSCEYSIPGKVFRYTKFFYNTM